MTNSIFLNTDILATNVSWLQEDLELFKDQHDILESMVCTIAILITFVMAVFVHTSFYKLMKRLPGRHINLIIYPYMVKWEALKTMFEHEKDISQFSSITFPGFSIYVYGFLLLVYINSILGSSNERFLRRYWMLHVQLW